MKTVEVRVFLYVVGRRDFSPRKESRCLKKSTAGSVRHFHHANQTTRALSEEAAAQKHTKRERERFWGPVVKVSKAKHPDDYNTHWQMFILQLQTKDCGFIYIKNPAGILFDITVRQLHECLFKHQAEHSPKLTLHLHRTALRITFSCLERFFSRQIKRCWIKQRRFAGRCAVWRRIQTQTGGGKGPFISRQFFNWMESINLISQLQSASDVTINYQLCGVFCCCFF